MPLIFLTQSSLCLSLPLYGRGLGERGGGTEDGNEAAEQAEGERTLITVMTPSVTLSTFKLSLPDL